jgi:ATP-binding cassette subfamily B protein
MDPKALRSCISFMPQEPFLFSTTLRDNILMGRQMNEDDLTQVIRICDLSDTIDAMPQGLETLVGERGVTLSGGQKQRLALARALVEETPVLILDDPVSQLDTRTARRVIDGILGVTSGRTSIFISHRLSALAACDVIYILKNGRITAGGTHDRLLKTSTYYRHAFDVQQFEDV